MNHYYQYNHHSDTENIFFMDFADTEYKHDMEIEMEMEMEKIRRENECCFDDELCLYQHENGLFQIKKANEKSSLFNIYNFTDQFMFDKLNSKDFEMFNYYCSICKQMILYSTYKKKNNQIPKPNHIPLEISTPSTTLRNHESEETLEYEYDYDDYQMIRLLNKCDHITFEIFDLNACKCCICNHYEKYDINHLFYHYKTCDYYCIKCLYKSKNLNLLCRINDYVNHIRRIYFNDDKHDYRRNRNFLLDSIVDTFSKCITLDDSYHNTITIKESKCFFCNTNICLIHDNPNNNIKDIVSPSELSKLIQLFHSGKISFKKYKENRLKLLLTKPSTNKKSNYLKSYKYCDDCLQNNFRSKFIDGGDDNYEIISSSNHVLWYSSIDINKKDLLCNLSNTFFNCNYEFSYWELENKNSLKNDYITLFNGSIMAFTGSIYKNGFSIIMDKNQWKEFKLWMITNSDENDSLLLNDINSLINYMNWYKKIKFHIR